MKRIRRRRRARGRASPPSRVRSRGRGCGRCPECLARRRALVDLVAAAIPAAALRRLPRRSTLIVRHEGEAVSRIEPTGVLPVDADLLGEVLAIMERTAPGHPGLWAVVVEDPEAAPVIVLDDVLGPVLVALSRPGAPIAITSPGGDA